jgi:hypothetical protein
LSDYRPEYWSRFGDRWRSHVVKALSVVGVVADALAVWALWGWFGFSPAALIFGQVAALGVIFWLLWLNVQLFNDVATERDRLRPLSKSPYVAVVNEFLPAAAQWVAGERTARDADRYDELRERLGLAILNAPESDAEILRDFQREVNVELRRWKAAPASTKPLQTRAIRTLRRARDVAVAHLERRDPPTLAGVNRVRPPSRKAPP